MHLFDDMCIVENVAEDGAPCRLIGSRLLVTNLFNPVQPLIRFELTRSRGARPEPCPCGRTLMRLHRSRAEPRTSSESAARACTHSSSRW